VPIKRKKQFLEDLRGNVGAYREKKLGEIRTVLFAAYQEILVGSPVDTGRFRSNWMLSLGAPSDKTVEAITAYEKEQPMTSAEATNIKDTLSKLGDGHSSVFISNNLPYARRLEEGHSTQNEGFVERAVANATNRLKAIDFAVEEAR
jgi:hypothetical protein